MQKLFTQSNFFYSYKGNLNQTIYFLSFVLIFLIGTNQANSQTSPSDSSSSTESIPSVPASTISGAQACPPPVCSISGSTTVCPGSSTLLCAPVGLAAYSWSTGATSQCISVTTPGTYIVTVTSVGGCSSTCNVTVTSTTCSISGSSSICNGGSTQLCALPGATSYSWSTGATTQCITVTTAGTYTVTECLNGCYVTCSKTVTVAPLVCSITGSSSFCEGRSTELCVQTGLSSRLWSTGSTSRCITVTRAGTYTVTITKNGCVSTCSKTITQRPTLNCNISGNTSICQGGSTQLCLPSGYQSYSWNTGARTRCITVTSAGTYYGNVNDGRCNKTCYVRVTVNSVSCSITGSSTICPGGSTQLCAPSGRSSYSWSTGATSQCITVNSAGTYSVVTSNGSCTSTCSKTVSVGSLDCRITGDGSICSGGSTQLCAPPGLASYSWSTGATTQCINVNSSGNYSVTVTNSGGCSSTCNKEVSVGNTFNCSITGNSILCSGGSTQLCAPPGLASYSWSTGATTQCINVNSAGNYSVTVTNSGGCSSTCNKEVTVGNSFNCNITGNGTICSGGSTQLCAPAGLVSYSWSTGATTQCIIVNSVGIYTVFVSDGNGCIGSCSKSVTSIVSDDGNPCTLDACNPVTGQVTHTPVNTDDGNSCTIDICNSLTGEITHTPSNPPNCNIAGNSFICPGGSSQLCAPSGFASYMWSTGATTQCINVNSSATYSVIVTNANGCQSICSKTVFINVPPMCLISGNSSFCSGGTTQLCGPLGYASYQWSTGATTLCIAVSESATYSLIVTDANGCNSICSKTVSVGNQSCSIIGNGSLCGGSTSLCGPAGASSYSWNTGATTECINVTAGGTYTVTAFNANGCSSTCSKVVTGPPSFSISGCNTISTNSPSVLCAQGPAVSYLWNSGATTQCISVNTPGTYSVMATDVNGCTATASQTVVTKICYESPTNPNVTATQSWTINIAAQTVTIRTTFAKTFVDNTYGTNAVSWPSGHTFSNLTGSDKVQLALYDINNIKKMEFKVDYISSSALAPSGYKSLGVTGGEGGMLVGVASDVVNAKTSLDVNLNDFGYVLTTNSPATNTSYVPNATYPNWIFDVWYEVTVKLSAFPAGFGKPLITDIHASPSKTGNNTEIVNPVPCTPCTSPLSLGNLVWFDLNNNGLKDANESGLANYTVKLYGDANNDNTPDGSAISTTTTDASGIYGFNGLVPGNYIVCVVLKTGNVAVALNGGDPDNNIDNDNNGLTVVNNELKSNSVTLNFGTEPSNDGDGIDGNLSVDFAIFGTTPVNQKCYIGVTHQYVKAVQTWTTNIAVNQATIRTTFSKNFVDNTYGTNAIGWPGGHSFSNLTGSDKLELALYDVNNVKKMEFEIDYISSSNTVPSGYKTLGVLGGDGGISTGNAADVISVRTSHDANFNNFGYVLTTNSPATNAAYAPNATYPNWIFDVWYEVTVNLGAFPAGFGEPEITSIHASPSKTGTNTEVMIEELCLPFRLASFQEEITENGLIVNAFPNPFNTSTIIEFEKNDKSSHVVLEVYTLSGAKVITLFDGDIEAGVKYKAEFKADGLPNGIYIYRLGNEDGIINGKLILMN